MNRYLIFTGLIYYPQGGWADFLISTESEEEAIALCAKQRKRAHYGERWAHYVDASTGRTVGDTGIGVV